MTDFLRRLGARLADHLVRRRHIWFLVGLVLTTAAIGSLHLRPLRYNRSLEGFFPEGDERLQLYQKNKEWFGGEGTLIVAYTDFDLWSAAGMQRQRRLAEAILKLRDKGVTGVLSLADRPMPAQPLVTVAEAVQKGLEKPEQIQKQIRDTPLYQGLFVAGDGRTTALWVTLKPSFASSDEQIDCLESVRETARQELAPFVERGETSEPAVAGTQMLIHDVYEYTEDDGHRLEIVAVLLMGLVIAVSFRSIRWVVLPLLIVYAARFWSDGLWGLLQGELTMVGSAISSLVAVIGVSTAVHFGVHYREARQEHDSRTAMRLTFRDIGPPVFWILATTAGGFAALLVCELKPVLDFAWLMLIASMLIGVAIMVFLPLGIIGFRSAPPLTTPNTQVMAGMLLRSLRWTEKRPWLTALALVLPFSLLGLGMWRLQPQTDFTENFRHDTEIYRSYDFIETCLGGAGQLDVVFDCPDVERLPKPQLDDFLKRLRNLEKELAPLNGVTKVLGLVDFLDFFDSNALTKNVPMLVRLKLLQGRERVDEALGDLGVLARLIPAAQVEKFKEQPAIVPAFWNRDAGKMRLTLQVKERLPSEVKHQLITAVRQKALEVFDGERNPQTTGIYVMLAHLIDSLVDDQNKTFALSLACQFGMALLAFGSFWLAVITMIPTVLPVVAVVGSMGWLGFPVNIATAMLASVAMGMTIDSSILYLYRFQQERRAGGDYATALARTHASAGVAVVISNIALVLGFAALIISSFIPLIHFGIFTGLALVGGMAGNLILLPLLLQLVPGIKRPPKPRESVGVLESESVGRPDSTALSRSFKS